MQTVQNRLSLLVRCLSKHGLRIHRRPQRRRDPGPLHLVDDWANHGSVYGSRCLAQLHSALHSPYIWCRRCGHGTRPTTYAGFCSCYIHRWVRPNVQVEDFGAGTRRAALTDATQYITECAFGLGRHVWLMPADDYVPYMKSFYSSIIIYNVATCVVKMSIMLQYRRIFTVSTMQCITLVGLVFEGVWAFTLSFLLPLVCSPVASFWDTSVPGKCLNELAIWYVMASINLVTDFITFSLPLPVIKSLQLPKRQKYLLMGVFCLGFL